MIDFSTLQGLTIPEGAVTQITDASGKVLWMVSGGDEVILEVEKITSDTYAAETTYTGEQFILLDIYPKTNGTVNVTYGGLTKTCTDTSGAAEPNAQQVFFGTFNGVTDEVETSASGELTIKGDFSAFGSSTFYFGSKAFHYKQYNGLISVVEWGGVKKIPSGAFKDSDKLVLSQIPECVEEIGTHAFDGCYALNFSDNFFNEGLISIGSDAFNFDQSDDDYAFSVNSITIPSTVTYIGEAAFRGPIIGAHSKPFLKQVIVLPTTPPTGLGTNIVCFGEPGVNDPFKIIVPTGCGVVYKAAEGWSKYADYIVEAM